MSKLAELQNTCVSLYQCQGRKSVFKHLLKLLRYYQKRLMSHGKFCIVSLLNSDLNTAHAASSEDSDRPIDFIGP